jgi:hypothetical protein
LNNNLIYWDTGISRTVDTAYSNYVDYNNFYDSVTADRNNVAAGVNDISVDPQFVDEGGNDFRVGENLKAKGWPGSFANQGANVDCIGYTDIGAVQRIEPAAGGGGGCSDIFGLVN